MFHFVFRMFSLGSACLPAEGMEAIPRQLASVLPPDSVRLGARVVTGEEINGRAVVVAAEGGR